MAAAVVIFAGLASSRAAFADDGDFRSCLASIRAAALSQGVSPTTFDAVTAKLAPNDAATFLDVQPEFSTPIWDYLAGLVDAERISDGKAAMRRWDSVLRSAQARFGVDKATIAAVWGIESNYGTEFGKRPVLQSLATLSCAGRRQDYFRTEFIDALRIVDRGEVSPDHFFGSWAGAFGHTQFMPSTFLRFAVDMDGNGRPDIVDSIPDALGSTANYLRKAGWTPGLPWGFEVRVPAAYSGPTGRRAQGCDGDLGKARDHAGGGRFSRQGVGGADPACRSRRTGLSRDAEFRCTHDLQCVGSLCAGDFAACPTGCAAGRTSWLRGRRTIPAFPERSGANCNPCSSAAAMMSATRWRHGKQDSCGDHGFSGACRADAGRPGRRQRPRSLARGALRSAGVAASPRIDWPVMRRGI